MPVEQELEILEPETPRRSGDRLSKRGQVAVILFGVLSLSTFFVPFVKVDPPVDGADPWSLAHIVFRKAPKLDDRTAAPLNFWKFSFAVRYTAVLLVLICVFLRPSRRALITISLIGLFLSGRGWWYLNNREIWT